MSYIAPTSAPVSDTWAGHVRRGSKEPGTDYACAYGTLLVAPGAGIVSVVDSNPGGAEGRRVSIDLFDGRRVSLIHNHEILVGAWQHVAQGGRLAISGASGFGDNWYYGPHSHVTLQERPGLPYSRTLDFQKFLAPAGGGSVAPIRKVLPLNIKLYLHTPTNKLLLVDHLNMRIRDLGSKNTTERQQFDTLSYSKVGNDEWNTMFTGWPYVERENALAMVK